MSQNGCRWGDSVAQLFDCPLCNRFVHRRYARLNVNEEGAWRGFADRQEMRFRRAFNECGKYRG